MKSCALRRCFIPCVLDVRGGLSRLAVLGFDHQTLLFALSSKIKQIKAEADVVYLMYTRRLSTLSDDDFHRKLCPIFRTTDRL
jgi:hypothetical protein